MIKLKGSHSEASIFASNLDSGTTSQVYDFINSEMTESEAVCIMPDAHLGSGCVVGYTQTYSNGPIDPDVVGCDIGCGMLTIAFRIKDTDLLNRLDLMDSRIRGAVPMGFDIHERSIAKDKEFRKFMKSKLEKARASWPDLIKYEGLNKIDSLIEKTLKRIGIDVGRFYKSLGTLGGGNHFIEVGKKEGDQDSDVIYVTIHTGSRNLGIKILSYWNNRKSNPRFVKTEYNNKVKEIKHKYRNDKSKIESAIKELKKSESNHIPASRYLEQEEDKSGYLEDMFFAQAYAEYNRFLISESISKALGGWKETERIESVHNYIDPTDRIIRKGAISAHKSKQVIIPINMAYGTLICEGLGNKDWNFSAPHGAGRKLSRGAAKKDLDMEEFRESMEGVFSTSVVEGCIDESPMAYKDPNEILEAITGNCVNILYRIVPIISIKSI